MSNLRHSIRTLLKQPIFSAIVITTFALGIGANSAVFSVINAVILRPLPFRSPNELVTFVLYDITRAPEAATDQSAVSYPDFIDWQKQNRVFDDMAVLVNRGLTLTDGATATHLQGEVISASLFPVLGVQPMLGRVFTREEDGPGHRVAILSHDLWQRQFGGASDIVGRPITLDGEKFQVIGVMPRGFSYPVGDFPPEIYISLSVLHEPRAGATPMTEQRGGNFLRSIARLKPTVSIQQAQANMDTITAALRRQYPDTNNNLGAQVWPLQRAMVADVQGALMMLCAMSACVLLVACVNVSNLLLARSISRQREISIRTALGAGRWQIVCDLLGESALLGLAGGMVGLLCATWGIDALKAVLPKTVPRIDQIAPDVHVVVFAAIISLLVGLIAGALPAWRASHPNMVGALNEASRGSSEGGSGRRTRGVLVVVEIVLALVLLASAGLLGESFLRLQRVRPGFDPSRVVSARIALPQAAYPKPDDAAMFFRKLLVRVSRLPGVDSAAASWWVPLSGSEIVFSFDIQERPVPRPQRPNAQVNVITHDYFKTMRTNIVRGRDFTERDDGNAPKVVIVSESFARKFFAGGDPVGKIIRLDDGEAGEPAGREIVGVVEDIHLISLSEEPKPQIYLPHEQFGVQSVMLLLRTHEDIRFVSAALRDAVNELDKDVPIYRIRPLTDYVSQSVAQPRLNALLVGLFALIALLLAAAGVFGVMSYSVTQRTQEIGIRFALGAQRAQVLRLVLVDGMKLVGVGVLFGVLGVFASGRILHSLLFGIAPTDVPTITGMSALLALVALIACWWPAHRASNVDPMIALRDQ